MKCKLMPPLIDCLFPVRRPGLLLPAASLPFFNHYVTVRCWNILIRISYDVYYSGRPLRQPFRCDICFANDWNCKAFALVRIIIIKSTKVQTLGAYCMHCIPLARVYEYACADIDHASCSRPHVVVNTG